MEVLIGKPSINGPFSMTMLNNQRVSKFHWKELETTNQRLAKAAIHLFRVSIATG